MMRITTICRNSSRISGDRSSGADGRDRPAQRAEHRLGDRAQPAARRRWPSRRAREPGQHHPHHDREDVREHHTNTGPRASAAQSSMRAAGGLSRYDAGGDLLHRAVQAVAQAAGEVDEPAGHLALGGLEVHDHRLAFLEPVGDLLGLIEAAGPHGRGLTRRGWRGEWPHGGSLAGVGRSRLDAGVVGRREPRATARARRRATAGSGGRPPGARRGRRSTRPPAGPGRGDRCCGRRSAAGSLRTLRLHGHVVVVVGVVGPEAEIIHRSLEEGHVANRLSHHVRRRVYGAAGGPISALPMRTSVAPHRTATSKSSLMPIEHTRSPWSSTSRRTTSKPGAAASGGCAGRADGHQPEHLQPAVPGGVHEQRRARRPAGSRPCPASPVALTWTSTRAPGCALGQLGDDRAAGRPSPRRRRRASMRTLLVCSWPMKCSSGAEVTVGPLGGDLLGVVLPHRLGTRRRPRRRRTAAGEPSW